MRNWIQGNIPKDTDIFCWITRNNQVYPFPCKYDEESWISFIGEKISIDSVTAYFPIQKPKPYNCIGNGYGYYIRAGESVYGFRLTSISWTDQGYKTLEKAIIAANRLKKLDLEERLYREKYEIVNGNGEVVKPCNKKPSAYADGFFYFLSFEKPSKIKGLTHIITGSLTMVLL